MSIKNSVFKGFDTLGITSPPQVRLDIDLAMVSALQAINIPSVSEARTTEKWQQVIQGASCLVPTWWQYRAAPEWLGTIGMVWRNLPDSRGVGVTYFKNNDSLAVQLGIRAGIGEHVFQSLAN